MRPRPPVTDPAGGSVCAFGSWEEFSAALGMTGSEDDATGLPMFAGSDEGSGGTSPTLSGTVTVQLDDGSEVDMDASAYMDQLKAEAQALRMELASFDQVRAWLARACAPRACGHACIEQFLDVTQEYTSPLHYAPHWTCDEAGLWLRSERLR